MFETGIAKRKNVEITLAIRFTTGEFEIPNGQRSKPSRKNRAFLLGKT